MKKYLANDLYLPTVIVLTYLLVAFSLLIFVSPVFTSDPNSFLVVLLVGYCALYFAMLIASAYLFIKKETSSGWRLLVGTLISFVLINGLAIIGVFMSRS